MREAVIVAARRTPIGKAYRGAFNNTYGATLGGPVRIPKVYDGRNKTFFYFSWEQFLQNQNFLPTAFSVPTTAYRNGDFSAVSGCHLISANQIPGSPYL